MTFRIVAALAALSTAVFLSGCTDNTSTTHDGHTDHSHGPETTVVTGEPAGYNDADVAFMTDMIPHHEQAIELTALVPDRSTNPELIALAEQIAATQQPEIDTMKAFLVQWTENPQDNTDDHGDHHSEMSGMVDEQTMAELGTLSGPEFDTLWLQSMIAHHEGAIEMAQTELDTGANADAKKLAQDIVAAQQAEIDTMNQMLGGTP